MPVVGHVIHRVQIIPLFIVARVSIVAAAVVNAEFCFAIYGDVSWISAKLGVKNLLINFLRVGFIRIEGEFHIGLIPFREIAQAFHVMRISRVRIADNFVRALY